MKVEALRDHENDFGETYVKTKGVQYEASDVAAQSLIANKLCKAVPEPKNSSEVD